MVNVFDFDGYPLGCGFINTRSTIAIRMMSRKPHTVVDEDFIEMRVRNAWEYRKSTVDTGSCRLVFGEADFLPGIVIDKFSDVLVVESLALGIDRWKPVILEKLKKVLAEDGISIRGVYERSDARVRLQEGMERFKGFIGDSFDTKVEIVENGVRYMVDVQDGQKTGFFLDQKYNRLAIQRLCKGKRVLDCFTHTGSFALNAGIAGASEVLGVDASELGVAQAAENAALNGLSDRVRFVAADVFDLLPELERQGEKFDVVILDPPAFTKSRNSVKNAVKGYREINLRGMKLVKDGGYLATCSCSHFMTPELYGRWKRDAIWRSPLPAPVFLQIGLHFIPEGFLCPDQTVRQVHAFPGGSRILVPVAADGLDPHVAAVHEDLCRLPVIVLHEHFHPGGHTGKRRRHHLWLLPALSQAF